jgi:hypothetical protein
VQVPAPSAVTSTPAPPEPDKPQHDLQADRQRVEERMRQELGDKAKLALAGERFVLGAPAGSGAVETALPFVERVLEALYHGRFTARPERMISVYLFPDAGSYGRYCQQAFQEPCISVYGFFSPSHRSLVMNLGLGIGTLSHELVHPILEADFPQAPIWLNEGIASLYEAPVMPRRGEIHGRKNWRHPRLLAALGSSRERDQTTLPALFAMSNDAFRGANEALHYAMARYSCQWLDEQGRLWDFYHAWRDGLAADPTGEKAFAKVLGRSPSEANADWTRWVMAL